MSEAIDCELDELWRAVLGDLKPYVEEFSAVKGLVKELEKRYSSYF